MGLFACDPGGGAGTPDAAGPDAANPDAAPPPDAVSPLAHCSAPAPLPSWATSTSDAEVLASCSAVSVRVTGLADGVVRLRYAAGDDTTADRPSWAVTEPPAAASPARVTGNGDAVELCTTDAIVRITGNCVVTATDVAGNVLVADTTGGPRDDTSSVTVTRTTPSSEHFYGFGEKTGPLNKRGQRMTFWNTDAYDPNLGGYAPDQDPLYLSIPFFIGLRDAIAYGVFTDSAARIDMDMARAQPGEYAITVHERAIDQYLIVGPAMPEVVRRYTSLTGRAALPPRWALGYHQSRWGYSPGSAVDDLAARFRSERIPADALWLDIQHMDGYRTFTWSPSDFPDPAGLIQRLADRGFKTVAIADPGIKVDDTWSVYTSGVAGDHFLRTTDGALYEGVAWPGAASFPDFTSPATRAWWAGLVGDALAVGLRGLWLDVNEPTIFPEGGNQVAIPMDLPVSWDGFASTLGAAHNAYALVEARASFEGMLAAAPDRRPFILSRAGYAGIQRYAAVWTGDVVSSWSGLSATMPMLLGMGLSGLAMVGSDVGGYSGYATPELYARWMALGSISPFFRSHVTSGVPGQEPWQFGTEVRDVSRALIEERYRLLPYLYSLMREATRTGAPVLRPLVYELQDDQTVYDIDDEAMLGPFLLAAPVFAANATLRSVTLPAGRWFDYYSGAIYDGPTTIDVDVTLAALPLFVRAGAIIPRGQVMQHSDAAAIDPLTLDLYPGGDTTSFTLYEDSGDGHAYRDSDAYSAITYTLESLADGARLTASTRAGNFVPPSRGLRLRVRRVDGAVSAVKRDGVAMTRYDSFAALEAGGDGWWLDSADRSIVVAMPDRAGFALRFVYDPTITELRPPVPVAVEVRVPDGTPTDGPIYIATDAGGWTQQPLTWTAEPGVAAGTVMVPRGSWFHYKYTRGDWDTVEKWPNCVEADNRYRLGAATSHQRDMVFTWRDWCP